MLKRNITALTAPIFVVILLDQITKHWVRLSPELQNWDVIPGWLSFHYTQNPGMAMGMQWFSTETISVIAIIATLSILAYVIYNITKVNAAYLFCMGLILGGAVGNVIDRLLMAKIGQYGGVLEGHVVDFIHFNLEISGYPVFPYIFNVADIAISTAIIAMIIFHKKIMPAAESHMAQSPGEVEPAADADSTDFSQ